MKNKFNFARNQLVLHLLVVIKYVFNCSPPYFLPLALTTPTPGLYTVKVGCCALSSVVELHGKFQASY
jgi:hypothetical protein